MQQNNDHDPLMDSHGVRAAQPQVMDQLIGGGGDFDMSMPRR